MFIKSFFYITYFFSYYVSNFVLLNVSNLYLPNYGIWWCASALSFLSKNPSLYIYVHEGLVFPILQYNPPISNMALLQERLVLFRGTLLLGNAEMFITVLFISVIAKAVMK